MYILLLQLWEMPNISGNCATFFCFPMLMSGSIFSMECGFAHWVWRTAFSWYSVCYDILCRCNSPHQFFLLITMKKILCFSDVVKPIIKKNQSYHKALLLFWESETYLQYLCKIFFSTFNHVRQVPDNTLDLTIPDPGHEIQMEWALFWLLRQSRYEIEKECLWLCKTV